MAMNRRATAKRYSHYITVVKAFRVQPDDNIAWKIKDYDDVADMYLFDTEGTNFGGTGKKFDWQFLKDVNINKPFFLSGGIAPDDVENIKAFMQLPAAKDLFALDINSRFEISPGKKDIGKVSAFIGAMKS